MDFIDQLKQFSKRVESIKDSIQTEEATKTSIIMPFFAMLGYDVFNPAEFVPEFTADVGIKKGEKVDYAILDNGQPVILVECKAVSEKLDNHASQLFRYFSATYAKFAILTNGIQYRFYTDLDAQNVMDADPFLAINILKIRENQVSELKKFCKQNFDIDSISSRASELKYTNEFKQAFTQELENPSDDFVRMFLRNCYLGVKTQQVIERFRPILKKALNTLISEMMNDKINAALGGEAGHLTQAKEPDPAPTVAPEPGTKTEDTAPISKIVTTEEELEAYFVVKMLLSDTANFRDITYKDTESYFTVLYKGNTRKWICRLKLTPTQKILIIPDKDKREEKYPLPDVYAIQDYKNKLTEVLDRYI